jgi:prepilin-type N-terminal cleavage/methylation domain-containing protein
MSLTNIKLNNQERGFTIVELLIVVVVIAILAAITIVSYNGITNRANASSAKSAASNVQKKIELFATEEGRYPTSVPDLTAANKSYTLVSTTFGSSDPTASATGTKGTGYVRVQTCSTGTLSNTTVRGARISWYDYERTSSQVQTIDVGDCSGSPTLSSLSATSL